MNALQLVNRLRQNCGVMGADLTTIVGLTGESRRMLNFINEAWVDIQTMRSNWMWLRKTITFPTMAGQGVYTLANIGLTDFGEWQIGSFRNYTNPPVTVSIATPAVVSYAAHGLANGATVTFSTDGALPSGLSVNFPYFVVNKTMDNFQLSLSAGGAAIATSGTQSGTHYITANNYTSFQGLISEVYMADQPYDVWRDSFQYGALRLTQTRPYVVSVGPDKSICLGPYPTGGYTVLGDYYSMASELSLDTTIPALPEQYHMAIVYRAMVGYGMYEAAAEVVQRGQAEFDKMIRRVHAHQIPMMQAAGALA